MNLSILGVTYLSDLYPNVKHKIQLLDELCGASTRHCIYDLGAGSFYQGLKQRGLVTKLAHAWRFCWGTLSVFARFLFQRTPVVYVTYPAPILALLLALIPRRPVIHIDAFISLYDTAVIDRALCSRDDWKARLLFYIERKAFSVADHILVDTRENAAYYATLFNLNATKFTVVPLSIPPLPQTPSRPQVHGQFSCLFVGSLVPLHGISVILDAATRLAHIPGLVFTIIGDGQEAWRIEQYLQNPQHRNLVWHRGMYPTSYIADAIGNADRCLGIFGAGGKTQRVLPYKIYYYTSLGKPFITLLTPCLQHYCGSEASLFLSDKDPLSSNSLDRLILQYVQEPERLVRAATAARNIYQQQLGPDAVKAALRGVIG